MIDLTTEFGQRVQRHLAEERVVWLTSVSGSSSPQPRPVWFLWEDDSFLIYSRPNTYKLQHIKKDPKVSLNFDGNGMGGDIVVLVGVAQIAGDAPSADQVAPYVEKYREGMRGLQMTPEEFGKAYSVPIRVKPIKLRGH